MFSVHAQVKYKKSVWGVVKGFIEKNTWAGLEDFYTALLRALQSEYCIPPAKAKGRRPRRGGTSSLQRPTGEEPVKAAQKHAFAALLAVPVAAGAAGTGTPLIKPTPKHDRMSVVVVVVMIALVLLNVILYFKLWNLEESPLSNADSAAIPPFYDFRTLK